MRIVFMGTPDFAVSILNALNESGHDVIAAVSQPDKPVGRHARLEPTAVKAKAGELGIEVLQPNKASDNEFIGKIKELNPDVIVVAAYGKILKPELLNIPKFGCINVHASLLPRWRGAAPIQWAVIAGDQEAGVTIMQMNEGLDTGDMLLKDSVKVDSNETGESLFKKLADLGSELIIKALKLIEEGKAVPEKQNEKEATYAPMLKKENGNIDWAKPAAEIERLIRGLYPWPGTYSYSDGKMIKVISAKLPDETDEKNLTLEINKLAKVRPGSIILKNNSVYVVCGEGFLKLNEIKPEGKKQMPAADYMRGNKLINFDTER